MYSISKLHVRNKKTHTVEEYKCTAVEKIPSQQQATEIFASRWVVFLDLNKTKFDILPDLVAEIHIEILLVIIILFLAYSSDCKRR